MSMKFLANLSRQKRREEINDLKMNEPKFRQQVLLGKEWVMPI